MKRNISKIIGVFAAAIMLLSMTATVSAAVAQNDKANGKISVVCTIFPQYDWVRQILGDKSDGFELTLLLDSKVDLHSYQPSVQDIVKLSACDIFIYVGGESDEWVEGALKNAINKNMLTINLLEELGSAAKLEELVEGMEAEEDDHDFGDEHATFDPDSVKDRPLSDFSGSWISGIPLINDGSLDAYIKNAAEAAEVSPAEQKAALLKRWASEYDEVAIKDGKVTLNGVEAQYEYAGFRIVESGDHISVWYAYKLTEDAKGLPAYLAFNDHGTGNDHKEEDEHQEEEGHEEIGHMHIRYGNESVDALISIEGWSTYYFDRSYSNEAIGKFMGGESSHGHGHEEEDGEYDEHVWLSLKNAQVLCSAIADALSSLDSGNAAVYEANLAAYTKQLRELDAEYKAAADIAPVRTLLFGDRFPFRYLVDDYGLSYYAAFAGCSAETEASFATIVFLAGKLDELALNSVMVTESSDGKIAQTIVNVSKSKNQRILTMDAMQSVTALDVANGAAYLDVMRKNLDVLKDALK